MPPLGIEYTGRFRAEARLLADDQFDRLEEALGQLPAAFGQPHLHSGLGIRRLRRNYFESRAGRDHRMVFTLQGSTAILRMVGNDDQVRSIMKNL